MFSKSFAAYLVFCGCSVLRNDILEYPSKLYMCHSKFWDIPTLIMVYLPLLPSFQGCATFVKGYNYQVEHKLCVVTTDPIESHVQFITKLKLLGSEKFQQYTRISISWHRHHICKVLIDPTCRISSARMEALQA